MRSTSLEAELLFVCFDDLFNLIKDIVCTVVDKTPLRRRQDPQDEPVVRGADAVVPRTTHADAIKHFNEQGSSTR